MRFTLKTALVAIALIPGALSAANAKTAPTTSPAPAATPAAATLIIDHSHSEAGFNIRHFFSKVHGNFTDFSGTIAYDAKNLPASMVEVTIKDTSISTGNDHRDAHLRTADFFWTAKYPTIKFKSTKVVPSEEPNHFQVVGDLTIRDVTKPVTLEAELIGMGPVTIDGRDMGLRAGFSAKTTINRKDFGIVWNKTVDQGGVMLGDDVELVLNVEAFTKAETSAAVTPPPNK
jgi:polyisoprenoid-binding protein YceI